MQNISKVRERFYPDDPRKEELATIINEIVEMGYDEFVGYWKDNKKDLGRAIMQFYMLDKTDLHKEFDDKILTKVREKKREKAEDRMIYEIKQDLENAKNDESKNWDSYSFAVRKRFMLDGDNKVLISMSYSDKNGRDFKTCYYGTRVIGKKTHPRLRKRFA